MATLSSYRTDTADFLNDPSNLFWSVSQLNNYINRARTRVALDSQCVRVLPPNTGSLSSVNVSATGSGYTSPTITVSAPDGPNGGVNAQVSYVLSGGSIVAVTVLVAGSGYVAPPSFTITDATGSGAILTGILSVFMATVPGQETYPLSAMTAAAQVTNPGALEVIGIQSISISWGSMKPTLDYRPWTTFQARFRAYNIGYQNYPSVWSMYGRGQGGQAYLWPIPASYQAMDVDCYCAPTLLTSDASYDAIPDPFTTCVPYWAAHLAYLNAQRKDDAESFKQQYWARMADCGVYTTPSWSESAYED